MPQNPVILFPHDFFRVLAPRQRGDLPPVERPAEPYRLHPVRQRVTSIAGDALQNGLLKRSIARGDQRYAAQLRLYPREAERLDEDRRHQHAARPLNDIDPLISEDRPLEDQIGGAVLRPLRRIAWAVHMNRQLRHPPRDLNKLVHAFSRRDAAEKNRVIVRLLAKSPFFHVERRRDHPLVMIPVLLSRLAIMPVHPRAAFVDTEWQARRSRVADGQFNMTAVRKEVVYFHVRAPDVAHDVTGPGARPDFLYQIALEFLLEFLVVDIGVERFLSRLTFAQGSQPVFRQNDNVFARLTGRAFIAVFNDSASRTAGSPPETSIPWR